MAQADICTSLEAELAALEQGPAAGATTNYRQYDAAVTRQRAELDRATRGSAALRLHGRLSHLPAQAFAEMRAADGDHRPHEGQSAAPDRRPRPVQHRSVRAFPPAEQVLSALAANRCGANYTAAGAPPPPANNGNFLDMLFGNARLRGQTDRLYAPGGQFGTYRTLCVRKCDGYYFPISFSTVPSRFPTDEQTCQSMCPGSDVALYIYRNPGEEVSQMVSLAGEPYSALPTAFRYRQEYDAACTCGAPASRRAVADCRAGRSESGIGRARPSLLPRPLPRPARGEDPETLANRAGDFSPKPVAARTRRRRGGRRANGSGTSGSSGRTTITASRRARSRSVTPVTPGGFFRGGPFSPAPCSATFPWLRRCAALRESSTNQSRNKTRRPKAGGRIGQAFCDWRTRPLSGGCDRGAGLGCCRMHGPYRRPDNAAPAFGG